MGMKWSARAVALLAAFALVGWMAPSAWAAMDGEESSITIDEPECIDPNTEYRFEISVDYVADAEAVKEAQLLIGDFWTVEEIEEPGGELATDGEWSLSNDVPNVVIWEFAAADESGRGGVLNGESATFAITATTGDVPTDNSIQFTLFGDVFTTETPHQIGPTQITFELCDEADWETDDDGGNGAGDDDGCSCGDDPYGDDDDRDEGGCSI